MDLYLTTQDKKFLNEIDPKDEKELMKGFVQTEYYMNRRGKYYFRNKFGNVTITSFDKNFFGELSYNQKYNIKVS